MLTFNPRTIAKEEALARRALELFLSVQGLAWAEAYPLAAYERTALPTRFQKVLGRVARGETLGEATRRLEGSEPIHSDVGDRAWQTRDQVPR